ncbi:MAG: hypothetical protein PHH26_03860 [Candidatus Thermoplasmatota archaeon]|nr:hypothetical protein [Candidatus Thermoplasmatota archaeon]
MSDVIIEVEGVEELQARLSDLRLVGEPLATLMDEASAAGRKAAELGIDGGLGIAVRSINREVKPMEARVYTAMAKERAMSIEVGRSPGVSPRDILPQIIRWKEAVGHPDPAITIAKEISRKGSKGKHFIQKAREAVAKDLPQLVRKMGGQVEEKWRQGE